MREALVKVRDQSKDAVIQIEAQALSEEVGSHVGTLPTSTHLPFM